ncbi:MAG: hypothetical protein D6814_11030 [Calditrichaeota bacterium]|nr:MAG: hypothetical protein D6814_11030 [Calditrichota bacterium]
MQNSETKVGTRSPAIRKLSWGHVEVEGYPGHFKDVKLFPGGAREWDWNETGTRHSPGIQPEDVEELLQHGASVVVLSRGMLKQLHVKDQTLKMLQDRGIAVHVLPTKKAVQLYNQLCRSERVGALIHSTC